MKLVSIGRLALIYLGLVSLIFVSMGAFFWREISTTSEQLNTNESRAAQVEIREALDSVKARMQKVGHDLSDWDETKQQLFFPDYYALWRDNRVRDAGLLPSSASKTALYGKDTFMLASEGVSQKSGEGEGSLRRKHIDGMPIQPPTSEMTTLFSLEQGDKGGASQGYLYFFMPVHADPAKTIVIGYLGLKFNLIQALEENRAYRFANLSTLKINLPEGEMIDAEQLLQHIELQARPSSIVQQFEHLLTSSMLRLGIALFMSLLLAAFLINRLVVIPLRGLSKQINALNDPQAKINVQKSKTLPLRVIELENVRKALNDYQTRLAELHGNLEQNNRDFYDQARHDALTGTFNRRAYDEDWRAITDDRRLVSVALVLFDCDHFKAVNDSYGHNVGDAVIKGVAKCLQNALRTNDRLYRIGGDEFAALIRDTDRFQAEHLAERCLEQVMTHDFRPYGINEPVTVSIGISLAEGGTQKDSSTLTELQKCADLAMYAAKRPGGQKIMFYTEKLNSAGALVANHAINAVFQAMQNTDMIELAYQAIVSLPFMHHGYSEALTRIRFEGKLIYPGDIFPIVEARNLEAEFDLAVIRAISRDMVHGTLPLGAGVSINISAQGIVNQRVVSLMEELLLAEPDRKIVVEITETALITHMETATNNIHRLRKAGALIALDDFGSGYSSLRYLASMPVDLVKFDISMIHLLQSGEPRQTLMIEEIARMAMTAGYELVAEGIEDKALLDKVIRLGFSHAQGYYFGKPGEPTLNIQSSS